MFTKELMRFCLASGRTVSRFLPPSLSIPSHLCYSGHKAKDTRSSPEPSASPNRLCLWVNGRYRAFTSPQSARGRHFLTSVKATNTQLEILWPSSSSLEHWVLISITGKILSGPRICLNRAQTNGIHFGGTFFFPHQVLFLHFLTELSVSTFSQLNKASKHVLAQSPLCFPPTPECPQGTSSSSTGTWASQPQVTECSNFKIVVVTSFVGQY